VWLVGGGQLAASFRKQRMIDQYIVSVIPTVLGSPGPQENLRLVECKRYPSGLVQLSYVREKDA